MGIEQFSIQLQCDLCPYTDVGTKVGRHVATTHMSYIKDRIVSLVASVGSRGTTRKRLQESTKWNANRITRTVTHLKREGKLFEKVVGGTGLLYSRAAWESLGFSTEPPEEEAPSKPQPEEATLGSTVPTDIKSFILSEEAWHRAAEFLITAHPDEFVRLFTKAYLDVVVEASTEDVILTKVAAMAAGPGFYDA